MEDPHQELHEEFINSELFIQYIYELLLYGEKEK
jgi:hypothetical protein